MNNANTDTRELRFTIWQFVRLMVHLEDRQTRTSKDQAALLDDWAEIWAPLDLELGQLAENDLQAYAEMMMDQELIIEDATAKQTATANAALQAVMAEMDAAIEKGGEDDLIDSLKFERRELRQLTRRLSRDD